MRRDSSLLGHEPHLDNDLCVCVCANLGCTLTQFDHIVFLLAIL